MSGLITESEWKGLSLKEAIDKANLKKLTYRIVEEDGKSFLVDADPKNNRINFRVRSGYITGAYPG
jgi:hypothetical protein